MRRRLIGLALGLCVLPGCVLVEPAAAEERGKSADERIVHEAPSVFNRHVYVVDSNGFRSMRFGSVDGEDQTRIRPGHPGQLPMPYLRSAAVGLAVPPRIDRLLVIGLGGGAFPNFVRTHLPRISIDSVEIDPVVARLAAEYFDVAESDKLAIHVMDAAEYVRQDLEPYDYILLDAYDADDLPAALTSSLFLERIHARLATGGVAVVNIAISSDFRTRRLIEKFRTYFRHCLRMRSLPSRNDVLLLADNPLPSRAVLREFAERMDVGGDPGFEMQNYVAAAGDCL